MSPSTTDSSSHLRDGQSSNFLETEGLTRKFGSFVAVDDVNISVSKGELHSVIGPNGAGKTTLFNLITGSLAPSKGKVRFDGEDISAESESERARRGIVRSFQITQLFPELSAHENLRLAAQSAHQSVNPLKRQSDESKKRASEIFEDLGINTEPEIPAESLSHGDKKKLEVGMAMVTGPNLLLLDEPTSGVSSGESENILTFIQENSEDLTILLIEHDMDLVLDVSDRITVLHQGSVVTQGEPDEVMDNEEVQRAYLGGA